MQQVVEPKIALRIAELKDYCKQNGFGFPTPENPTPQMPRGGVPTVPLTPINTSSRASSSSAANYGDFPAAAMGVGKGKGRA